MKSKETSDMDVAKIAIVGMALRVPGARTPAAFWNNLRQGVESIEFFSDEELTAEGVDEAILKDPRYIKAYGYLPDSDRFDAAFFDMPRSEAGLLDPQHRVFLECCWECLEDAGYAGREGISVGVFGGVGLNYQHLSYLYNNFEELTNRFGSSMAVEFGLRNDFIATRASYLLNLNGPSMTVQSACSTSLVAVHLAAQSIISGECDMAMAGGLTINLSNKTGYFYTQGSIQSPDGHCRAFDAQAEGTVGGNGGGVVLLKSLDQAVRDRDHIYAVILGSSVKNDGSLKVGFTAPSVVGQADTIAEAISVAGVSADSIGYLEAHGTATRLGDPIEVAALSRAFRESTEKKGFCALGSVKTNIGHLDAGAGIAGLIKAALTLKNREIPPSLHYSQPNPEIDFEETPFFVNSSLKPWQGNGVPLRAGVSSFGIGGTNAHVVLEEAPQAERTPDETHVAELFLLSAKSEEALERSNANLQRYLETSPEASLSDIAHTLRVGRKGFAHRRALVCRDREEAVALLDGSQPGVLSGRAEADDQTPVAFLLSGQGSQYADMGRELFKREPVFRQSLEECCRILKGEMNRDMLEMLYPDTGEQSVRSLDATCFAQPLLFSLSYSLAKLWEHWGLRPDSMIGHSLGELTAACISGVFTLPEALKIVAARGRLMQEMPAGTMLAVPLPEERAQTAAARYPEVSIAALNAPESTVLAGPSEAIEALSKELEREGVSSLPLHTSHAFHSSMMDPVLERFEEVVRQADLKEPRIPFISCVTGQWISKAQAQDPSYWARQIRGAVRFDQGLQTLLQEGPQVLLEVGPGEVLRKLALRSPQRGNAKLAAASLPSREQSGSRRDDAFIFHSLAQLWLSGQEVEWEGFQDHRRPRRVSLPTYPFEPSRFAVPSGSSRSRAASAEAAAPSSDSTVVKRDLEEWFYAPAWKRVPVAAEDGSVGDYHWLVVSDEAPLADSLIPILEADSPDCVRVRLGESFSRQEENAYTLNAASKEDAEQLARNLAETVSKPLKVVHLATLTPDSSAVVPDSRSLEEMNREGFNGLLNLMTALSASTLSVPVDLAIVSNQMHDALGEGNLSPYKSPMDALVLCLPQEKPRFMARSIDVAWQPHGDPGLESSARFLLQEILSQSLDRQVALRGKNRWVACYEQVHLGADRQDNRIQAGDVCLITGGLGNIGLAAAHYLAERYQARLTLVGRHGLPSREQWEDLLAQEQGEEKTRRRIEKLKALEDLGAEVVVVEADVSDEAGVRSAVEEAESRLGPVKAVFHAAADLDQPLRSLDESDADFCQSQFGAKAQGAINLANVLGDKEGVLFVLFSSISSVLGGLGYTAYAASNLFLDGLAAQLDGRNGQQWISINWDAWNFQEGPAPEQPGLGQELAALALKPDEGMEALARILDGPLQQVVVSSGDLEARISRWVRLKPHQPVGDADKRREASAETAPASLESDLEPAAAKPQEDLLEEPAAAAPLYADDFVAPRSENEKMIGDLWQDLLETDRISVHDDFLSLGGNSLFLISFIDKVKQNTGVDLTAMQAAGTLEDIAAMLDEKKKVKVTDRIKSLLE